MKKIGIVLALLTVCTIFLMGCKENSASSEKESTSGQQSGVELPEDVFN